MLWIVVPAYNEGQSLPRLLPKLQAVMEAQRLAYRLVVVDDGSVDGTADTLSAFSSTMPIEVVRHWINRGLGETERDGFEYVAARAAPDDIVVRLESDDTHEPEYLLRLVGKLGEGYDVAAASRFQPGGGELGLDRYRAFISRAANVFMKVVFGIPGVREYSCGYRAYRVRVLQDALRVYGNNLIQLRGLGFTSTLEIIVKLHLLGCRFTEAPFVLRYDQKQGSSKMIGSITTLGYLIMAVLYHWPFGGWRRQYRGLATLYRENREHALEQYGRHQLSRRAASEVSL
jgi:dolichol-phosphate mannosyltransferase